MAGITTVDTIVDRVKTLLEQYLNSEVDLVDTRNNGVAVDGSANDFTTPEVNDDDIQTYVDRRSASPVRLLVEDRGSTRDREFQLRANEGDDSTLPRFDRTHAIAVTVMVASNRGDWTADGARRRCNRIAEAVAVIMGRYPALSVPGASPALATLVADTYLSDDGRATEAQVDDSQFYARTLVYDVRTIEARA